MTSDLRIDSDRLWQAVMDMARIGATPNGGSGRVALTELDREGRDLFVRWCKEAGCAVRIDRLGNTFARREGAEPGRAPVMTGSHLDTQPLGGRFDGIYGVLAGLEVVRTLNDAGVRTRAPIDVANWTDEEGVRFGAGTLASAVFAGLLELEPTLGRTDLDGERMGDALAGIGYAGPEPVGGYPVAAFFEAHIEQGPILEAQDKLVGAVLGAQAQRCFRVTVEGEEGHAGTVPMGNRRDALVGAARMIQALDALAYQHTPHPVITVGALKVRPNSRNTIPGQVVFSLDSRHPDEKLLAELEAQMRRACETIAAAAGLTVSMEYVGGRPTVSFDPQCIAAVRCAADRLGLPHMDVYSGAGHDACNLARYAPTGMIFVPCERGVSHNEKEYASPEALAAGANVLLHVILERAEIA